MTRMTLKQTDGIGQATSKLLRWALTDGELLLTATPIEIMPGAGGDYYVTLNACRASGADYQARVAVDGNGEILTNALTREWNPILEEMGPWGTREIRGVTR